MILHKVSIRRVVYHSKKKHNELTSKARLCVCSCFKKAVVIKPCEFWGFQS